MKNYIITYITTLLVFTAIDAVWLGVIAKNLYQKYLGHLLTDQVNWLAAVIFYLLFILGLVVFVIFPNINQESITKVALYGALFGLITYATYDLTNLATIKNWPLNVTIIDLAWGAFIASTTSIISISILKKLF